MKNFKEIDVLGYKIASITNSNLFKVIDSIIAEGSVGNHLMTVNSEYFLKGDTIPEFSKAVHDARARLADGVVLLLIARLHQLQEENSFRNLPNMIRNSLLIFRTGYEWFLTRDKVTNTIPERIIGSQIIHPLCRYASRMNLRVALYGGLDTPRYNVGSKAGERLKELYPELKIVDIYPGNRQETLRGEDVAIHFKKSQPDIIITGLANHIGETWLNQHLKASGAKIGINLGVTFDYLSGNKKPMPKWISKIGLEWLLRPILSENSLSSTFNRISRVAKNFSHLFIKIINS